MVLSASISRFRYRFITPHWMICVLACAGFGLFFALGAWQLHRADEKRHILAEVEKQSKTTPTYWEGQLLAFQQFEPIAFKGQFLPQVLFLDNQHHQHRPGFHVISPILMPEGQVVLVDRGFVPRLDDRNTLPDINPVTQVTEIKGSVYFPSKKTWVLGEGIEIRSPNAALIETFDFELISQFLHKPVYPFIIRLDSSNANCFTCEWINVVVQPERHIGYAIQWFSFAGIVLLLFVALNIKKRS